MITMHQWRQCVRVSIITSGDNVQTINLIINDNSFSLLFIVKVYNNSRVKYLIIRKKEGGIKSDRRVNILIIGVNEEEEL